MLLPVLRLTFLPPSVSWPPFPLPHAHSPQDIIVGRPRDGNDRVAWLGDRGRYAEALSVAEEDRSGADTHTHLLAAPEANAMPLSVAAGGAELSRSPVQQLQGSLL